VAFLPARPAAGKACSDNAIHTATAGNSTFDWTTIDHPLMNGNTGALLFVTPNWNPPGGVGGTYNNHAIGVWYTGSNWAIFNEDGAGIPVNAAFNVMLLTQCNLSCVPCACHRVDFNGDGVVNLEDFARLAPSWLRHDLAVDLAAPSDLVNIADLAEFANHWLEHCP
jgi:hypothetical protein